MWDGIVNTVSTLIITMVALTVIGVAFVIWLHWDMIKIDDWFIFAIGLFLVALVVFILSYFI